MKWDRWHIPLPYTTLDLQCVWSTNSCYSPHDFLGNLTCIAATISWLDGCFTWMMYYDLMAHTHSHRHIYSTHAHGLIYIYIYIYSPSPSIPRLFPCCGLQHARESCSLSLSLLVGCTKHICNTRSPSNPISKYGYRFIREFNVVISNWIKAITLQRSAIGSLRASTVKMAMEAMFGKTGGIFDQMSDYHILKMDGLLH